MTWNFDLERHIELVRQVWPQINEQTRIVEIDSHKTSIVTQIEDSAACLESQKWAWVDKTGIRGWLWRVGGMLFNRHNWIARGACFSYEKTETILETIKIRQYCGRHSGGSMLMRAGYSRINDTLYIANWETPGPYVYSPLGMAESSLATR